MVLIKNYIEVQRESGLSKYRIGKNLGVNPIMIDHYLTKKVRTPSFRVCKTIYDNSGVVVFPYSEEELEQPVEQELLDL